MVPSLHHGVVAEVEGSGVAAAAMAAKRGEGWSLWSLSPTGTAEVGGVSWVCGCIGGHTYIGVSSSVFISSYINSSNMFRGGKYLLASYKLSQLRDLLVIR